MKVISAPNTIDVHAHFLPPAYAEALAIAGLKMVDGGIPVPTWSPDRALSIMDEVGIARAVLSVSSPHVNFVDAADAKRLCRSINDYAAEIRLRHPQRFGTFAILPLPEIRASLAEATRALDQLGLEGIALPTHAEGRYLGDPHFTPLLELLDERGATVFVHPTTPCCFEAFGLELPAPMMEFPFETTRAAASLLYSGAVARHGRINFILPHGGGTLPFLGPRLATIGSGRLAPDRAIPATEAMEAFSRFYYDTTACVAPQQFAALRALAPVSHLLYGSDFPFAAEDRLRSTAKAFAELPLTPDERQMIQHGNATRLFATTAPCLHAEAGKGAHHEQ